MNVAFLFFLLNFAYSKSWLELALLKGIQKTAAKASKSTILKASKSSPKKKTKTFAQEIKSIIRQVDKKPRSPNYKPLTPARIEYIA